MSGYTISRLHRGADESRLQEFLERCSDYYLLHEGWPTPKDAGEHELSDTPPGRSSADVFVFGMGAASGEVVAIAQLMRHYPAEGDWWIGLLLVAPSLRSSGLGARLLDYVKQFVRAEGGRALHLSVATRNPRAEKFWQERGFVDTNRPGRVTARSGHVEACRILWQDLTSR